LYANIVEPFKHGKIHSSTTDFLTLRNPMTSPSTFPENDLSTAGQTWSIADVERETGLGKDTLRVWERRYGFPVPLRDRIGERVYPDEQLQRLRLIKRLLDAGWRPGKVVPLGLVQLQTLLNESGKSGSSRRKGAQTQPTATLETEAAWLQWLAQDRNDLVRQALQQLIVRQGLGNVVDQVVAPLCVLVGQGWLRGELSVYQEHLFTETLQSVLREAIASVDASGQSLQRSPRVLLTTTPNEQHGLGLLMAECHFALESCVRFVLGTSTPLADIVQAVRQLEIDVLALSFSAYASRRDMMESLQQLKDQLGDSAEIWVGGAAAASHARALPEGMLLMQQPGDVSTQVAAWRARKVPPAA
jgi:DNA-binding transcriptional MerR regulator/methylmalonyl-CoA mutase cobalamin-binding subunit